MAMFAALPANASAAYSAGQVWAYRTRVGDEGSLLKIQQVQQNAILGPIYHISVIGFHLSNPRMTPEIPHSPVSQATLDASVTHRENSNARFPDAAAGIIAWRQAKGGVFTITVAQIVDLIDKQTATIGN